MSKRIHILGSACNMIGGLTGVLGWSLRFALLMFVPKAVLAAKLLAVVSGSRILRKPGAAGAPGR